MVPSNSNLNKENCSSTSSNCVVWQGRDIPCLNLCNGDSVSDVIYKLAEEVCNLLDNIGLDAVKLSDLVEICKTTAEPAKTLTTILNTLIDRLGCVNEKVDALPPIPNAYEEPELTYPTNCNIFSGDSSDLLTTYVSNLATKICNIANDLEDVKVDVSSLQTDVTSIKNVLNAPPETYDSCISGTSLELEPFLNELSGGFCDLSDNVGLPEVIVTAIAAQCEELAQAKQLMKPTSLMQNITSPVPWKLTPANLAESFQNLWLTVCDIRGALKSVLENCCAATCDDILIDFYQKWDAELPILYLNFKAKSKFINGFYDCGQTPGESGVSINNIVFTDIDGISLPVPVKFRDADYPTDLTGYLDVTADLGWIEFNSLASLNLSSPLTATAELCFTNGTTECVKCYTWTINRYLGGCCEVTATGAVTIKYKVCDAPQVVASPYPTSGDNAVVIPAGLPQNIIVPALPSGIDPGPTTTCNAPEVTITLTTGQVFVIPKGATVTYISDITKLENAQCIPNIGDIPTGTTTGGGGGGDCDTGTIDATLLGSLPSSCQFLGGSAIQIDGYGNTHCGIKDLVCVSKSFGAVTPGLGGCAVGDYTITLQVYVNGLLQSSITTPRAGVTLAFGDNFTVEACIGVNAGPTDNVDIVMTIGS